MPGTSLYLSTFCIYFEGKTLYKGCRMNAGERKIITITSFGHFMSHFNMMVFPALILPLTGYYHSNFSQVVQLSFLMYLFYGISALPWGMVTDRFGAKRLLAIFFLGTGLCSLAGALFMGSSVAFSMFLAGIGIFSGIYHPAGIGLISRGVRQIGKGLGINGVAGNLGFAFGPLIAGFINWKWGPRAAYFFLGVFNLVGFALLVFLKVADPEEGMAINKVGSRGLLKAFIILCVAMIFGGITFRGLTVTLPSLLQLRNPQLLKMLAGGVSFLHSHNVVASILTSLIFVIGIFGVYLGGYVADHADLRRAYIWFNGLAFFGALGMAYFTDIPLVAVSIFYVFFLLGMQPIENTLIAAYTPDRLRHSGYGVKFVLKFGVGALAVRLIGWIKDAWSIQAVFLMMAMVSVLVVAIIFLLITVTGPMSAHSS